MIPSAHLIKCLRGKPRANECMSKHTSGTIKDSLRRNDSLLTLGAGNIGQIAACLPQRLGVSA